MIGHKMSQHPRDVYRSLKALIISNSSNISKQELNYLLSSVQKQFPAVDDTSVFTFPLWDLVGLKLYNAFIINQDHTAAKLLPALIDMFKQPTEPSAPLIMSMKPPVSRAVPSKPPSPSVVTRDTETPDGTMAALLLPLWFLPFSQPFLHFSHTNGFLFTVISCESGWGLMIMQHLLAWHAPCLITSFYPTETFFLLLC